MLTLRPRAARPISLPRLGRSGDAPVDRRSHAGASRQGERPPVWIVLPAVLVTLFELLPLLYLAARTLDAGETLASAPSRRSGSGQPRCLAGAVAVSAIAIAVPLAWLTSGPIYLASVLDAAASLRGIPSLYGAGVMAPRLGTRCCNRAGDVGGERLLRSTVTGRG